MLSYVELLFFFPGCDSFERNIRLFAESKGIGKTALYSEKKKLRFLPGYWEIGRLSCLVCVSLV